MPSSRNLVSPGEQWHPPSADLQNAWTRKAMEHSFRGHRPASTLPDIHSMRVRLQSDVAVQPGTPVGIGAPIGRPDTLPPAPNATIFTASQPTPNFWAIADRGIPAGGAASCVLFGLAWANVNVVYGADRFVDWDGTQLVSGARGHARLPWNPAGSVQAGEYVVPLLLGFGTVAAPVNTVPCTSCIDGMPDPLPVRISGVADSPNAEPGWAAKLNRTHYLVADSSDSTGCARFVSLENGPHRLDIISSIDHTGAWTLGLEMVAYYHWYLHSTNQHTGLYDCTATRAFNIDALGTTNPAGGTVWPDTTLISVVANP